MASQENERPRMTNPFIGRAMSLVTGTAGVQTQYGIEVTDEYVWLSIQGSVQREDWLFNFDSFVKPYRHMKKIWFAHRGFVRCWKLAQKQITDEVLEALNRTGLPLRITGYSHGAAIALLAHEDFGYMGFSPETVVFGCPRVLWMPIKSIRERFDRLTIVQNRGDIVTHVPFALMGFRHVGKIINTGECRIIGVRPHLDYSQTAKEI